MRKNLIILLTFVGGLFYFLEFFLPEETVVGSRHLSEWVADVGEVLLVIGALAVFLGLINLLRAHFARFVMLRTGWYNSAATIITFFLMFSLVGLGQLQEEAGLTDDPKGAYGMWIWWRQWVFEYARAPLDSTVFALLAFYIASAAYRAFRVRSMEATLMMAVAFFVMLGQIPWIAQTTEPFRADPTLSWVDFSNIKEWLKNVWNSAAQRGILFGVTIGSLAVSIRIWLSLERGAFFDEEV